jgi:polyhydroxybutyrate depolymerase
MNATADEKNFIAVYPNGTGFWLFLNWNAGGVTGPRGEGLPNDVAFLSALIDDVAAQTPIDSNRVFAAGISNGGMMCYRLAAELSDRIAAIAPVAGTMTTPDPQPTRPVPIIHFHGTKDRIVPSDGPAPGTPDFLTFFTVEDTLRTWCEINGCDFSSPVETQLPDVANDGTTVHRAIYGPGTNGAEIISLTIENGGHTWPGRSSLLGFLLGRSTRDISANELIWEFFERHPLP